MNSAIEIHDSRLTSITLRGDLLELCLRAYIHKSDGTPGFDAGTSGLASFRRVTLGVLEYCEEGMLTLNSGSSHSAFRRLFYCHCARDEYDLAT